MKNVYIVTGASGHLGKTIVNKLCKKGASVRALILPGECAEKLDDVVYFTGDTRKKETLVPLFEMKHDERAVVIHTAGIIDISGKTMDNMYAVNVGGTENIIALCKKYNAGRLVYVSSVHAIPEGDKRFVQREIKHFSKQNVVGGYAKTKAEATQAVMDAIASGLDAVVVHPSGIMGPYGAASNHLVQMVDDYMHGRLPACVHGGYDFVDVRDVADGCIAAADYGRAGECYILSNRHYEVRDVLKMVRSLNGGKRLPVLPMWVARAATPIMSLYARVRKMRPLYTRESLNALSSSDNFSHDKATRELHYHPRDFMKTVADTVTWIKKKKLAYN
ncbi:MAG: SDR family NAD(P)-dependent oxidoreductase [Clostridia bacterium]